MFKTNDIVLHIGGDVLPSEFDNQLCRIIRFNVFNGMPVVKFLCERHSNVWHVKEQYLRVANILNRRKME